MALGTSATPRREAGGGDAVLHASAWPAVGALVAATAGAGVAASGALHLAPLGVLMAGYVLGAVAAPVMVLVFRVKRRVSSSDPWFVERVGLTRLSNVSLLLGWAAGLMNAWWLATELARR